MVTEYEALRRARELARHRAECLEEKKLQWAQAASIVPCEWQMQLFDMEYTVLIDYEDDADYEQWRDDSW